MSRSNKKRNCKCAEAAAAANHNTELLVRARFEAAVVINAGDVTTAMLEGSTVALPSSVLQEVEDAETGADWIRQKTRISGSSQSPQWCYGYSSGSAKRKREMRHVLAAYVFMLHELPAHYRQQGRSHSRSLNEGVDPTSRIRSPAARMATVVARVSSPPFTLASYRRQPSPAEKKQASPSGLGNNSECPIVPVGTTRTVGEIPLYHDQEYAVGLWQTLTDGQDENRYFGNRPSTHNCRATNEWIMRDWDNEEIVEDEEEKEECQDQRHSRNEVSRVIHVNQWLASRANRCRLCLEPHDMRANSLRRNTMELLRPILILQRFLRAVPLGAFDFYFDTMDFRIQHRWLTKIAPTGPSDWPTNAAASAVVAGIASSFSLAKFVPSQNFHSRRSPAAAPPSPTTAQARKQTAGGSAPSGPTPHGQMALQSCADLLLDVFSSLRVRQILVAAVNATVVAGGEGSPSLSGACDRFGHLVQDLVDEFSPLLAARTRLNVTPGVGIDDNATPWRHFGAHASISALVEEVLRWVVSDPKYQSVYESLLAFRDDELETAVQQLFKGFVEQQLQHHETRSKLTGYACGHDGGAMSSLVNDMSSDWAPPMTSGDPARSTHPPKGTLAASRWNRRWFFVPNSFSIVPARGNTEPMGNFAMVSSSGAAPSLLTVIGLIRVFSVLDVVLDGLQCVIESGMPEIIQGIPASPTTALVLDGRSRRFGSFPNGLSAAASAAIFGSSWNVVAYEGHLVDHGLAIELLFFLLPTAYANAAHYNSPPILASSDQRARQVCVKFELSDMHSHHQACLSVCVEVTSAPELLRAPSQSEVVGCVGSARSIPAVSQVHEHKVWIPSSLGAVFNYYAAQIWFSRDNKIPKSQIYGYTLPQSTVAESEGHWRLGVFVPGQIPDEQVGRKLSRSNISDDS
ncbi:hypothetical protein ON010_g869 [Phytophthora cinnamomi]|nr:hypothetical protein ON010_g869 [Phytophthora cinnamomi]